MTQDQFTDQFLTLLTCVIVAHLANVVLAAFMKWRRGR